MLLKLGEGHEHQSGAHQTPVAHSGLTHELPSLVVTIANCSYKTRLNLYAVQEKTELKSRIRQVGVLLPSLTGLASSPWASRLSGNLGLGSHHFFNLGKCCILQAGRAKTQLPKDGLVGKEYMGHVLRTFEIVYPMALSSAIKDVRVAGPEGGFHIGVD